MINRAELTLEERLFSDMADMKREIEALKTLQPVSAANIYVSRLVGPFTTSTVPNGSYWNQIVSYQWLTNPNYYISEVGLRIYLNNYGDPNYLWPSGASITTAQVTGIQVDLKYSFGLSSELVDGKKVYTLTITNNTGASVVVYVDFALTYPQV